MNGMRNGMIILEQTDNQQKALFIEEEHLDWLKLNAMFKKRDKEKAAMEHRKHIRESHKRAWKRYTINTFSYIGIRIAFIGAAVWTVVVNLVHPVIGIPVALYCLSTACINFGVWFGKWVERKS